MTDIQWTTDCMYGLVGFHIDVRETETAGLGAFAKICFKATDPVTVYDGTLVLACMLPRFDAAKMRSADYSHVMRVKGWDYAIIGHKTPLDGRGGGQFVNHSSNARKVNVIPRVVRNGAPGTTLYWQYWGELAAAGQRQSMKFPVVVMTATRDIKAGEQLFWSYPKNTLVRCGIPLGDSDDVQPPCNIPYMAELGSDRSAPSEDSVCSTGDDDEETAYIQEQVANIIKSMSEEASDLEKPSTPSPLAGDSSHVTVQQPTATPIPRAQDGEQKSVPSSSNMQPVSSISPLHSPSLPDVDNTSDLQEQLRAAEAILDMHQKPPS